MKYAILVAVGLCVFRAWSAYNPFWFYLCWNLFLAWVPLLLAQIALKLYRRAGKFTADILGILLLWLLFLPNAPYVLTDIIHVMQYESNLPYWFDAVLILYFSWISLLLGMQSVRLVQQHFLHKLRLPWQWFILLIIFFLSSLAIFLGRVLRWNSWNFFTHPLELLGDIWNLLASPLTEPLFLPILLFFFAFQTVTYLLYYDTGKKKESLPDQN